MSAIIKSVSKEYGDFQALNHIDLEIFDGEFVAILGPSGCGKTTLLRLLGGFDKPSQGQIIINNELVSSANFALAPNQRNVAMVFQSFALWPHLNVRDHIEFPLIHDQFTPESYRNNKQKRIDEVLKMISLQDKEMSMPRELSGGQKQRVALGRAIAPEPKLLLMDEPLSALDAELRIEMRREIQTIHQMSHASIIYVTHDQGEALGMADRIVVMNQGRIEQVGSPEEIFYQPQSKFVATFVGKGNLFKGAWKGNHFSPLNSTVIWENQGTTQSLKDEGLYILRPEQINLSSNFENKLVGLIKTKQFQGKEYHYSIDLDGEIIIAQTSYTHSYEIGDRVGISPISEVK